MDKPRFEVADVIRNLAGADGIVPGLRVSSAQQRVLNDLAACRTAKLGGHVEACDACGEVRIAYNSCRNRHCPKCQAHKRAEWLEARCKDLLPVQYFHVVFTLPAELAALALQNKREIYNALFAATADTLKEIAADPKHLGAQIGFIAVLHTWGQTLVHHPHVHCVIPGGGLSPDGTKWIPSGANFFLHVRVLSRRFRTRMLAALKAVYDAGRLEFHGSIRDLRTPACFRQLCNRLENKEWVVYAKPPFGSPEQVLKYLAGYTHRVAISNHRIVDVDADTVSFRYKDYARGSRPRIMKLGAVEFLRRFLQHVLPDRFVRIRHHGFLANRARKQSVPRCRELIARLGATDINEHELVASSDAADDEHRRCQACGNGQLRRIQTFAPQSTWEYRPTTPPPPDTS